MFAYVVVCISHVCVCRELMFTTNAQHIEGGLILKMYNSSIIMFHTQDIVYVFILCTLTANCTQLNSKLGIIYGSADFAVNLVINSIMKRKLSQSLKYVLR